MMSSQLCISVYAKMLIICCISSIAEHVAYICKEAGVYSRRLKGWHVAENPRVSVTRYKFKA